MSVKEEIAALREQLDNYMKRPSQRASIQQREKHWEIPDPMPIALPINYDRPPTIQEMIGLYLANEKVQEELRSEGYETFEEADDFEPDEEEMLPLSGFEVLEYEMEDEPVPTDGAATAAEEPQAEPAVDTNSDGEAVTPTPPAVNNLSQNSD